MAVKKFNIKRNDEDKFVLDFDENGFSEEGSYFVLINAPGFINKNSKKISYERSYKLFINFLNEVGTGIKTDLESFYLTNANGEKEITIEAADYYRIAKFEGSSSLFKITKKEGNDKRGTYLVKLIEKLTKENTQSETNITLDLERKILTAPVPSWTVDDTLVITKDDNTETLVVKVGETTVNNNTDGSYSFDGLGLAEGQYQATIIAAAADFDEQRVTVSFSIVDGKVVPGTAYTCTINLAGNNISSFSPDNKIVFVDSDIDEEDVRTASITVVPIDNYEITKISYASENLTVSKNTDGSYTITFNGALTGNISIPITFIASEKAIDPPALNLDGDVLTITDNTGRAKTFNVYSNENKVITGIENS